MLQVGATGREEEEYMIWMFNSKLEERIWTLMRTDDLWILRKGFGKEHGENQRHTNF
jgi:hypothetical protein